MGAFRTDGKVRGQCARSSSKEGKSKCLPAQKAYALGKKGSKRLQVLSVLKIPNKNRRGKAQERLRQNEGKRDNRKVVTQNTRKVLTVPIKGFQCLVQARKRKIINTVLVKLTRTQMAFLVHNHS